MTAILRLSLAIALFTGASALATTGETLKLQQGKSYVIHTTQVGDSIVGVTPNLQFVAIVCNDSTFGGLSADLLIPGSDGKINTDNYNSYSLSSARDVRSPSLRLSETAAAKICAEKSGWFQVQIKRTETNTVVDLVL